MTTPVWNPDTGEWNPVTDEYNAGATPLGTFDSTHGDIATAEPMSEQPGQAPSGTVPAPGLNLLTDVRARAAGAPPVQVVHHVMETVETGTPIVQMRTVVVGHGAPATANDLPVALLHENPKRTRALIKVVSGGTEIRLVPGGSGAQGNATTIGGGAANAWPLTDVNPPLVVETQAAVWAYTPNAGTVLVAIWEELLV